VQSHRRRPFPWPRFLFRILVLPALQASIVTARCSAASPRNRGFVVRQAVYSSSITVGENESAGASGLTRTDVKDLAPRPGLARGLSARILIISVLLMTDVTQILSDIERGDPRATEQLLPLVYEELRKLAAARLAQEKPGQTLQATALVHEAYVRLVDVDTAKQWASRGHFFAAAAEAMRRILIENARRKQRLRHGGGRRRVDLSDQPAPTPDDALLALDDGLSRLADEDPVAAKVVELRHFAGMGHETIAAALGLTIYQARQKWTYARAWLRDALGAE
jgi:RNA polymerase sigma factor (TIGR02999 family)